MILKSAVFKAVRLDFSHLLSFLNLLCFENCIHLCGQVIMKLV
jgi:hypothetical protein